MRRETATARAPAKTVRLQTEINGLPTRAVGCRRANNQHRAWTLNKGLVGGRQSDTNRSKQFDLLTYFNSSSQSLALRCTRSVDMYVCIIVSYRVYEEFEKEINSDKYSKRNTTKIP